MSRITALRSRWPLIVVAAAVALITACSDSPTQPGTKLKPQLRRAADECRSGWVMVNGRLVCLD